MKQFIFAALVILLIGAALSQRPYARTDLAAYRASEILFMKGKNPYDPAASIKLQQEMGKDAGPGSLVWNPPSFFVTFGLLSLMPPEITPFLWPVLIIPAAFGIMLSGAALSRGGNVPEKWIAFCVFSSISFYSELVLLQISSLIILLIVLGCILFLHGKTFLSGLCLSALALKPHLGLFPVLPVLFWAVNDGKWQRVFSGLLIGVLAPLLAAEFISPGVLSNWLTRSHWPVFLYGSTLTSFIRAFRYSSSGHDFSAAIWIVPAAGAVLVFLFQWKFPRSASLAVAMALTPLFAPYGYLQDQGVLYAVQGWLLAEAFAAGNPAERRIVISSVILLPLLCLLFSQVAPFGYPLVWLVSPLVVLTVALIMACRMRSAGAAETAEPVV